MKQIKSEDISKNNAKLSVRKVGTILGSGALCVLMAGAISVGGLFNKNGENAVNDDRRETTTTAKTDSITKNEGESAYTTLDTVIWRKASINEYEIAKVEKVTQAETAKATEKTEASSQSQTTAETTKAKETKAKESENTQKQTSVQTEKPKEETSAETVKTEAPKKIMYLNDDVVNVRAQSNTSSKILTTLSIGDKVTVLSKPNNDWYEISFNGGKGYISSQYLSDTKVEKPKQTAQTAAKPAQPTTIQSSSTISYTDEEFDMLCYVLQGEVGNCSEASKIAVANVIINRVKSPAFPNSLSGVLTSGNQFTAISGYYNKTTVPNQNTIDCAKRALGGEDNSNGAIFYYAPKYCGGSTAAWFETLTFCMELDGQRYFKN